MENCKDKAVYTIGFIECGSISFIGWNSETDYYELIGDDILPDNYDWCFDIYNYAGEEVHIYRFNALKDAQKESIVAQKEFDEEVVCIKMIKDGDFWEPCLISYVDDAIRCYIEKECNLSKKRQKKN